MQMSDKGLAVVRSFEGRALKAYKDSVNVITVGYGNTNYDKFAVEYLGGPITMATRITESQAEYLLIETMKHNYMPPVDKAMGDPIAQQAADCGGSFHYNTGAISRASWVKLWKNGSAPSSVEASLLSWNKAGGKVLAGLTRRRAREAAILLGGDYGPEGRTSPPVLDASGNIVKATSKDHPLVGTPGMLRLDDVGPAVADFNAQLVVIGYKNLAGERYTLATQSAVIAIQKANNMTDVDGIAGPATRAVVGREADMKRKLKTAATATGGTGVTGVVADVASGGGVPAAVWIAAAAVAVIAFAWIAWRYRDELISLAKRNNAS